MNFEQPKNIAGETAKEKGLKGRVAAALLAGTLMQPSEALSAETDSSAALESERMSVVDSEPEGIGSGFEKFPVLYSDYVKEKGRRVDTAGALRSEDVLEEERDRRSGTGSFGTPAETAINSTTETMKNAFHVNEVVDSTREKLYSALQRISTETGSSVDLTVQSAGRILINATLDQSVSKISRKIKETLSRGLPEAEANTMKFIASEHNAENMYFTKELGKKDDWKLTLGVDPGLGFGGKDTKVGATFRMIFP